MASIFRESALKRLSSPEQLDRALYVTTPKDWLALLTLMAVATLAAAWSFVGEVSTYVRADGILLNRGGRIIDAVSSGTGTLTRIHVAVGDSVERGALLAEISNNEALKRYESALSLVEERRRVVTEVESTVREENRLLVDAQRRHDRRLAQLERAARESLEAARTRLEDHRTLYDDRVVTRVTLERSQAAFDRAQRELFNVMRERDELESRDLQRRTSSRARLVEEASRLQAAERQANELRTTLDTHRITASGSGRVTEIKAAIGAILRPGQPVLSLTSGDERLGALIYVPPAHGKRVRAGMKVLVSPSTLRREEYGSMRGTVESVSAFPVTRDGMIAVLQNQQLALQFAHGGPPYAGEVAFEPDPSTVSGFAWTSPKAASETVSPGTLVAVEVKVESQPPITLVVPLVRQILGL